MEIARTRKVLDCFDTAEAVGMNYFSSGRWDCHYKWFWEKKLTKFGARRYSGAIEHCNVSLNAICLTTSHTYSCRRRLI